MTPASDSTDKRHEQARAREDRGGREPRRDGDRDPQRALVEHIEPAAQSQRADHDADLRQQFPLPRARPGQAQARARTGWRRPRPRHDREIEGREQEASPPPRSTAITPKPTRILSPSEPVSCAASAFSRSASAGVMRPSCRSRDRSSVIFMMLFSVRWSCMAARRGWACRLHCKDYNGFPARLGRPQAWKGSAHLRKTARF